MQIIKFATLWNKFFKALKICYANCEGLKSCINVNVSSFWGRKVLKNYMKLIFNVLINVSSIIFIRIICFSGIIYVTYLTYLHEQQESVYLKIYVLNSPPRTWWFSQAIFEASKVGTEQHKHSEIVLENRFKLYMWLKDRRISLS